MIFLPFAAWLQPSSFHEEDGILELAWERMLYTPPVQRIEE